MQPSFLRLSLFIFLLVFFVKNASAQFQYISPVPGSKMHHPETNIILRNGDLINAESLKSADLFTVTGSSSGRHDVSVILSDDGKTVLIRPLLPFNEGETVSVSVDDGMKTTSGKTIKGTSFSFSTIQPRTVEMQQQLDKARERASNEKTLSIVKNSENTTRGLNDWKGGIPPLTLWNNSNPTAGDIFFHNFNFQNNPTSHYCIITNNADSVYGTYNLAKGNDFYINHNGYLTLYNQKLYRFEKLDSNYASIDNYYCGNGYLADVHEFQLFPDGHSYLLAYDPEPFDMTVYDASYNPNAIVIGCILQELDANKNVVFQWRSWDHFEVTDATHTLFTTDEIDYVHGNSIELDNDGNLLLSCRHMEEVTKINHTTGDIIWRLGGSHNQFTFIGDPQKFSYQHDVRRISNGHITMMDNGNWHSPPHSFAKEYALDEVNKTATLVWQYDRAPTTFLGTSSAMGSVQRLSNGNTLICWGLVYSENFPSITEVDPEGNIVWEMRLDPTYNDAIYRAHRFTWTPCSRPTASSLKSSNVTKTSAVVKWTSGTNATGYQVQYKKSTSGGNWTTVTATGASITLNGLTAGTKYKWRVRSQCTAPNPLNSGYTDIKNFTTLPQKLAGNADAISFDVFPNPAHGMLNVKLNMGEGSVTILISNLLGQQVLSKEETVGDGEVELTIPVEQITPGIYLVEVLAGNEKFVRKVILQ